jgi:hypothetical protein
VASTFGRDQEKSSKPSWMNHEQHCKNVIKFLIDGLGKAGQKSSNPILSYLSGTKESEYSCVSRIFGAGGCGSRIQPPPPNPIFKQRPPLSG